VGTILVGARLSVKELIGLLMLLAGAWMSLLVIGFASMVDPSLEGLAWWVEFWEHLTHGGSCELVIPLMLVAIGARLLFGKPRSSDNSVSKPAKKYRDEEIG
jgi:hypothetical protein